MLFFFLFASLVNSLIIILYCNLAKQGDKMNCVNMVFFWMMIGVLFVGIPFALIGEQIDENFERENKNNINTK